MEKYLRFRVAFYICMQKLIHGKHEIIFDFPYIQPTLTFTEAISYEILHFIQGPADMGSI